MIEILFYWFVYDQCDKVITKNRKNATEIVPVGFSQDPRFSRNFMKQIEKCLNAPIMQSDRISLVSGHDTQRHYAKRHYAQSANYAQ